MGTEQIAGTPDSSESTSTFGGSCVRHDLKVSCFRLEPSLWNVCSLREQLDRGGGGLIGTGIVWNTQVTSFVAVGFQKGITGVQEFCALAGYKNVVHVQGRQECCARACLQES
ncbi:hypothetical protein AVEN_217676-1 [Araneus ventricosus]|uniref:Uncharacterized protein n=1 Tax=Araneus ventricosus TaxID=182803 RepID=A0A4Y2R3T1_ARAVE|nr:hypothetical protein AVEN_217676-1 [Araneus ventricosus]